jgi:hypothetical protein
VISSDCDQLSGGSMSPLRSSAAFAGSAMNLIDEGFRDFGLLGDHQQADADGAIFHQLGRQCGHSA